MVSCLNELALRDSEIHLMSWPVNSEAPFRFEFHENITHYKREEFNDLELLKLAGKINPDIIFSPGWMDKGYCKVCKKFKSRIPVVTGLDNQWYGTSKQKIASLLSRFLVRDKFTHVLAAGEPQKKFAQKLGFNDDNILTGLYSADVSIFDASYQKFKEDKIKSLPKRFIYVGRYVDWKGMEEMWEGFLQAKEENNSGWELWCLGTGEMYDAKREAEGIKHFGFVQPKNLEEYIKETSVFVLPSRYEPWGVVVQEYAAAGYPLICTDKVGAASAFLKDGVNGVLTKSNSVESLKNAFSKFMKMDESSILKMGDQSRELALNNSPKIWADKFLSILN